MPEPLQQLRVRQLSAKLKPFADLKGVQPPRKGWIRTIRSVLGMSGSQLARRLAVSQPAVSQFEKAESDGSISLDTLHKVAAALECELVYALVPRAPLEEILETRAREVAARIVSRVSHSMRLERQEVSSEEEHKQIEELAGQLLVEQSRSLWDES